MSANKYSEHLLVLPEDDANRQIAVGFQRGVKDAWRVHVLNIARGWRRAWDLAEAQYIPRLRKYTQANLVLLIDFDGDLTRPQTLLERVPEELRSRVFIIGILTEPEKLKAGNLEGVGKAMIDACADNKCTNSIWEHELLKHNTAEVARAKEAMGKWLL